MEHFVCLQMLQHLHGLLGAAPGHAQNRHHGAPLQPPQEAPQQFHAPLVGGLQVFQDQQNLFLPAHPGQKHHQAIFQSLVRHHIGREALLKGLGNVDFCLSGKFQKLPGDFLPHGEGGLPLGLQALCPDHQQLPEGTGPEEEIEDLAFPGTGLPQKQLGAAPGGGFRKGQGGSPEGIVDFFPAHRHHVVPGVVGLPGGVVPLVQDLIVFDGGGFQGVYPQLPGKLLFEGLVDLGGPGILVALLVAVHEKNRHGFVKGLFI